jgi:NADH dehydrogenase FAD-containing subunit
MRIMAHDSDQQQIGQTLKTSTVKFTDYLYLDNSEVSGTAHESTVKYDYLVVACGAENATFGVPGVKEHACFLKEIW